MGWFETNFTLIPFISGSFVRFFFDNFGDLKSLSIVVMKRRADPCRKMTYQPKMFVDKCDFVQSACSVNKGDRTDM